MEHKLLTYADAVNVNTLTLYAKTQTLYGIRETDPKANASETVFSLGMP
jgi:hypothetical protein